MSSTAPPKALLPKGGWVTGSFVGPYEAVAQRERPAALVIDARVLELVMLPGSVKGLRPSRAPSLRAGAQPPLTQARLDVLAELDAQVPREPLKAGAAPPPPLPLVHRLALRDVFLVDWSAEPLADEVQAARGLLRGTLYARAGPEPWSLWRWLWLLLLLLLLLLVFLLFARCAPLEPVAAPLRRQLAHGVEELRWRVLERAVLDPDAELIADATRGTGGGAGQGGTGGAGAGGAGAGGAGSGGAGAGSAGAAGDAASGQGEGASDPGRKPSKDPASAGAGADKNAQPEPGEADGKAPRRYSIDEALEDPAAFFSTCGRPLYLSGDLLFDVDKHTLEPSSRPLLQRLVRLLKEAPDEQRILLIAGHTDPRGEGGHNDELSLRRAETVAAFIAENGGVRRNTLLAEGHGEREPLVPAKAPDAQQRFNRRVEVSVRCPGGS